MTDIQKFEQVMKEFSQIMFEQNVPVGISMTDSGKFLLKFSFSSTYRNFLTFVELVEYVIHFDMEKGMYHQEQRPFDKLKELWDEWLPTSCSFECFVWMHGMNREWATYQIELNPEIHNWLAEYCGFLTTAEVRQALQQLKNQ